jgi:hypothetical protein
MRHLFGIVIVILLVPKLLFGNGGPRNSVSLISTAKQSFAKVRSQTGVWERGDGNTSPFIGTWKAIALPPGNEVTLWLLQVTEKDGQPQINLLVPPNAGSSVTAAHVDDRSLRCLIKTPFLTYSLAAYVPKGQTASKQLLGSLEAKGRRDMLRLERTDLRELPPGGVVAPTPAAEALQQAEAMRDAKDREVAFRSLLNRFAGQSVAFHAALELTALAAETGAADSELKARADTALKLAEGYGREMEMQAAVQVARQMARGDKTAVLALDYARKAQKLMKDDDPAAVQVRVLRTLVLTMSKAGHTLASRPFEARAIQLDDALDREYQQATLPFVPEPFAGRKTLSDRVVAVELFTSSSCPYCIAADLACLGIDKSLRPSDVVVLAYHLPIPVPDPLANRDNEKRAGYYAVQATSALLINGKVGPIVGGSIVEAKDRYDDLRKAVVQQLEVLSPVKLKVSATRRGDKIDIQTEVAELNRTGDDMRLRLALVEDMVRYSGPNGQRFHFHVVRALLGGVEGMPLRNKATRQTTTISLQGVTRSLQDYLNDFAKVHRFLDDERPLDFKRLKIVALVQDDKIKEILQAAQAEVPDK